MNQQQTNERGRGGENSDGNSNSTIKVTSGLAAELAERLAAAGMEGNEPKIEGSGPKRSQRYDLIVQGVARYNYLSWGQLARLYYWNLTAKSQAQRLKIELGALAQAEWLMREQTSDWGFVYRLGHWGRVLQAVRMGRTLFNDRRVLRDHDLIGAEFMSQVVAEARGRDGSMQWFGEYETQMSEELRPDGIGRVTVAGARLDFFLEADNATEREWQFGGKFFTYQKYLEGGGWRRRFNRESFPVVAVVTAGKELRLTGMIEAIEARMRSTGVSLPFYFTTQNRVERAIQMGVDGPLFGEVWSLPFQEGLHRLWPVE